ncbi:MAG: hypothetical protein LUD80_03180 [Clostridiales bacterium]|nr:hypothetical protein [Clostridiales bacterium]
MKKRLLALLMALAMMLALAACGGTEAETATEADTADAATENVAEEEAEPEAKTENEADADADAETAEPEDTEEDMEEDAVTETVVTRIGSLKGPTSIGLTEMMSWDSADYSFTMETDASALLTEMVSGELDIALTADPEGVGLLPQPSVTAALNKLEVFSIVLDLTKEWGAVSDTDLITGVTVVRTAFLEEHPDAVARFLTDHLTSTTAANEDVATTAQRMVDLGILESAAVAETAIPYCNVTCVTGQDMKDMVSAYLQVLYDLEPSSVGGTLPGDDFYYLG